MSNQKDVACYVYREYPNGDKEFMTVTNKEGNRFDYGWTKNTKEADSFNGKLALRIVDDQTSNRQSHHPLYGCMIPPSTNE